jgi:DNA-binding NarL/FixJ family response regulator
VDGIEVVSAGEASLAPSLTRRLIAEHVGRPPPRVGPPPQLAALTDREREVPALVAHGRSNDEIAAALAVGVATVKTHVNRILARLGPHQSRPGGGGRLRDAARPSGRRQHGKLTRGRGHVSEVVASVSR